MSSQSVVPPASGVTSDDRLWAALAYFPNLIILPVLILVMEPNKTREFQRYHAIQSLGLTAIFVLYAIILTMVQCVLGAVMDAIGLAVVTVALSCVLSLLTLVPLVVALYCAYQAYSGKTFEIPVLTEFMRQQKWL